MNSAGTPVPRPSRDAGTYAPYGRDKALRVGPEAIERHAELD